jgi:hypothetical protein
MSGRRTPTRIAPAVRSDVPLLEPAGQLLEPAAAEERRLTAVFRQAAVEENGQIELHAHSVGERESRVACQRLVFWTQRHEGNDVGRSDARMSARVAPKVNALHRAADPRKERLDEFGPGADEREDGAMVVAISVNVQQPRGEGEGVAERRQDRLVTTLGDVRDGLERQGHGRLDYGVRPPTSHL